MNKTVYFAHGKESGPWGAKIRALADIANSQGYEVFSPDYSSTPSPDERAKQLVEKATKQSADDRLILVGSSMGSYVSTVASKTVRPDGLFLLAPAFYLPGYNDQNPTPYAKNILAIHGWGDEVVPVENAIRFSKQHSSTLHLIDGDHQLMAQLPQICLLFERFLMDLDS